MESIHEQLNILINTQLRTIFQLTENYDISLFESSSNGMIIRISTSKSPRLEMYKSEDYESGSGTPRQFDEYIETTPRDELCNYVSQFKNDFVKLIHDIINRYVKEVTDLTVKLHTDRVSIRFKYIE